MPRTILYIAFFLSGAAGLVYEVVWSRYLALFVGHSAEAQVLVIGMFLGGLALGSVAIGRISERIRRPLLVYAALEVTIAGAGLGFHAAFGAVTSAAYESWFPALQSGMLVGGLKWLIASVMVFLPAILLGTTFPLMAAGLTRLRDARSGRVVSLLYFANSFGGAVFVLVAGFGLIPTIGLPGTLVAAAALNIAAALGTAVAVVLARSSRFAPRTAAPPTTRDRDEDAIHVPGGGLARLLLATAALTAVASFAYQIGWIRMLSLVMGSATHSFEIMLSAFIAGLAIGALLVRGVADRSSRPLRTLGRIQWAMGLLALATLPIYTASFGWVGDLVARLPESESGYLLFGIARYGIAAAVMLPATVLAGMTLPLITAIMLRTGSGERAIGLVYGINTAGAIVGVVLAGLVALPALGLKGMLLAGALLDMGLGVVLLARDAKGAPSAGPERRARPLSRFAAPAAAAIAVAAGLVVGYGLSFDRALLTSGTFRFGPVDPEQLDVLYYADGRTATVGVHRTGDDGLVVLTSNGKPDASLTDRWLREAGRPVDRRAIRQQDEATQMMTSLVALGHARGARRAVVVGHGSGMSAHFLLTDPGLRSLVTVEIEPRIVDASALYYPANRLVFDDPRSRIAIADAKSFFARSTEPFDLILSEPSNPWVSGTASLFSVEFYRQVRARLSPGGVFAQWFHLYETDDRLVGTVIAALHEAFPSYAAYLVGDTDVMIVASPAASLPRPDWGILEEPTLRAELQHLPPLRPHHLDGLKLFERGDVDPLFPGWTPANSDFRPVLDTRSERARFLDAFGHGFYGLATDRFQIAAALGGWFRLPGRTLENPMPGLAPLASRSAGLAARTWLSDSGARLPSGARGPAARAGRAYAELLSLPADASREDDDVWRRWIAAFVRVERILHGGTAGFADRGFYDRVRQTLAEADPPDLVRSVVDFHEGLASWDFRTAASASVALIAALDHESDLLAAVDRGLLLDATVVAWLRLDEPERAREALKTLAPLTGRSDGDFRLALLRAHAGAEGAVPGTLATR